MALTLDNAPSTRQLANNQSSLTYSFTYGGGNGAIYVAIVCTAGGDVSTVTWNGESLTRLITQLQGGSADHEIWWLRNPSGSGAANVVITTTAQVTYILSTALSLLGSIGTGGATNASASASNTISVADGSWVVISGSSDAMDVSASTNVTATPTSNPVIGYYGPKSGAGNITLTYTGTNAISVAVEVIDSGGGGGGGGTTPVNVLAPRQGVTFSSAAVRSV
jgi:hypothetical protein